MVRYLLRFGPGTLLGIGGEGNPPVHCDQFTCYFLTKSITVILIWTGSRISNSLSYYGLGENLSVEYKNILDCLVYCAPFENGFYWKCTELLTELSDAEL